MQNMFIIMISAWRICPDCGALLSRRYLKANAWIKLQIITRSIPSKSVPTSHPLISLPLDAMQGVKKGHGLSTDQYSFK
jgi:hypothetical protein